MLLLKIFSFFLLSQASFSSTKKAIKFYMRTSYYQNCKKFNSIDNKFIEKTLKKDNIDYSFFSDWKKKAEEIKSYREYVNWRLSWMISDENFLSHHISMFWIDFFKVESIRRFNPSELVKLYSLFYKHSLDHPFLLIDSLSKNGLITKIVNYSTKNDERMLHLDFDIREYVSFFKAVQMSKGNELVNFRGESGFYTVSDYLKTYFQEPKVVQKFYERISSEIIGENSFRKIYPSVPKEIDSPIKILKNIWKSTEFESDFPIMKSKDKLLLGFYFHLEQYNIRPLKFNDIMLTNLISDTSSLDKRVNQRKARKVILRFASRKYLRFLPTEDQTLYKKIKCFSPYLTKERFSIFGENKAMALRRVFADELYFYH